MTDLAPGTMTIGPVGLDVPLRVPDEGQWRGEQVTISGSLGAEQGYSLADSRTLRSQFQGLGSLAQKIIPVRWGLDDVDGFYAVDPPEIKTDGGSFTHGVFDFSVRLTRVRTWQQLVQQERVIGALRSKPTGAVNAHGVSTTNTIAWHSPGVGALGYLVDGETLSDGDTIDTGDGSVTLVWDSAETLFNATAKWQVRPDDFYLGGARILVDEQHDGTFRRVVGDQMSNHPGHWAISNGRLTVQGAADCRIKVGINDGTGWASWKTFQVTYDEALNAFTAEPSIVRVVRNTPERAAVRVVFGTGSALTTLDVALRRGASYAECLLSSSGTVNWGVKLIDPDVSPVPVGWGAIEPGTTHVAGIHATSYDPDGNKVFLASPQVIEPAHPDTCANVGLYLPGTTRQLAWGVGIEAGVDIDTFTDHVWRYFAAQHGHSRPVIA